MKDKRYAIIAHWMVNSVKADVSNIHNFTLSETDKEVKTKEAKYYEIYDEDIKRGYKYSMFVEVTATTITEANTRALNIIKTALEDKHSKCKKLRRLLPW